MTKTKRVGVLRTLAFQRQGGCCCYCTGKMLGEVVAPGVPYMVTAEHLRQQCQGGLHHNNVVAACQACNNARPKGLSPSKFAVLRRLLLPAWPACTKPPPHISKTLSGLNPKSKKA